MCVCTMVLYKYRKTLANYVHNLYGNACVQGKIYQEYSITATISQTSTKWTATSYFKSLNIKRPWHMALEIQVLAWDISHKNVVGLNRLMGFPLFIIGSHMALQIRHTQTIKNHNRFTSTPKDQTLSQK